MELGIRQLYSQIYGEKLSAESEIVSWIYESFSTKIIVKEENHKLHV